MDSRNGRSSLTKEMAATVYDYVRLTAWMACFDADAVREELLGLGLRTRIVSRTLHLGQGVRVRLERDEEDNLNVQAGDLLPALFSRCFGGKAHLRKISGDRSRKELIRRFKTRLQKMT